MPGAAESWTVSPDGRTWTFRLRRGLTWSDGRPLTAEDFVWSFRRQLLPATAYPYASRLFPLRNARAVNRGEKPPAELGARALDAQTVRLELDHPAAYLPDVLATSSFPVPRHRVEALGTDWIRPQNFVGNGPFVLERWVPNGYVRAKKNPRFHAAADVKLDAVMHYPGSQGATAVRRFRAGELDFLLVTPPEQAKRLKEEFPTGLRVLPTISMEVIAFNTRSGPTADPRVRRALSMAIGREPISRGIVGAPTDVSAYGYVPPGVASYAVHATADFAAWTQPQRSAEARRLLAAAGYGPQNPLRIRLGFATAELNRKVAAAVAAMWRSDGVQAELDQKEMKALIADVNGGRFDAARFSWNAGYDDPVAFLERMYSGAESAGVNQSGYRNPKFDELLRVAQDEADVAKRAALLRQAETLALADHPVAPLYILVGRRLVSARASGFVENLRGTHPSRFMSVTARP
jgi:ABC-type oligopeptide transport system substrate-binding subunit